MPLFAPHILLTEQGTAHRAVREDPHLVGLGHLPGAATGIGLLCSDMPGRARRRPTTAGADPLPPGPVRTSAPAPGSPARRCNCRGSSPGRPRHRSGRGGRRAFGRGGVAMDPPMRRSGRLPHPSASVPPVLSVRPLIWHVPDQGAHGVGPSIPWSVQAGSLHSRRRRGLGLKGSWTAGSLIPQACPGVLDPAGLDPVFSLQGARWSGPAATGPAILPPERAPSAVVARVSCGRRAGVRASCVAAHEASRRRPSSEGEPGSTVQIVRVRPGSAAISSPSEARVRSPTAWWWKRLVPVPW